MEDDLLDLLASLLQRRAAAFPTHQLNGTAHVQIHKVHVAVLVDEFTDPAHLVPMCGRDLDAKALFVVVSPQQSPLRRLAIYQRLGQGHLATRNVRAELRQNSSER
jgi:hypothetical protein